MITIEGKAVVTEEGKLVVDVPPSVEPGEHQVVVVIDQQTSNGRKRAPLTFSAHNIGPLPEDFTFRREDLYDDWGR